MEEWRARLAYKLVGRGVAGHQVVGRPAQAGMRAARRASALVALRASPRAAERVASEHPHAGPRPLSQGLCKNLQLQRFIIRVRGVQHARAAACLRKLEDAPGHERGGDADREGRLQVVCAATKATR
jgi:hypothetical protein